MFNSYSATKVTFVPECDEEQTLDEISGEGAPRQTQSLSCRHTGPIIQISPSMRKQLDPRIPTLISNNVAKNHRSFIVLVGDKGRDQVRSTDCL